MITNATIIRITHPSAATAGGEVTYSPAAGVLSIRCAQTAPTRRQRYQLGAVISEATAVVRVLARDLGDLAIGEGDQVQVKLDRHAAAETYIVVHVSEAVKAGMDNVSAFLRKP